MKRISATILVLIATLSFGYAQPGRPPMERIHAAKMAYITDRLRLSFEQSGNFVPVYNDYEGELRGLRMSFFKKYKGATRGEMNDNESRQFIDDDLDYQQQVLDLKRRYNDRFLKVISPQQLAELYKAEREFRQMLMKRLDQRHGPSRFR